MREKYDSLPSEKELLMRKERAKFIKEIESEIEEGLNKIYNENLKENKFKVFKYVSEDVLFNSGWDLDILEGNLKVKGYEVEIKYSILPITKDKKHDFCIEIKW